MTKPLYLPTSVVLFGHGLPRQCGRHGAPAVRTTKAVFLPDAPQRPHLLLLAGVVPGVSRLPACRGITVPAWPVCRRCLTRRYAFVAAVAVCAAAALTLAVLAVTAASGEGRGMTLLAAVVTAVSAMVLADLGSWREIAAVHLSEDRQNLVLRRPDLRYRASAWPAPPTQRDSDHTDALDHGPRSDDALGDAVPHRASPGDPPSAAADPLASPEGSHSHLLPESVRHGRRAAPPVPVRLSPARTPVLTGGAATSASPQRPEASAPLFTPALTGVQ